MVVILDPVFLDSPVAAQYCLFFLVVRRFGRFGRFDFGVWWPLGRAPGLAQRSVRGVGEEGRASDASGVALGTSSLVLRGRFRFGAAAVWGPPLLSPPLLLSPLWFPP